MARRFAVVVAAHRTYETLELCLWGFKAVVADPADLIFVDNGSGGWLSQEVRRSVPDATILTLPENRLFCGGYNAGLQLALERGYDYALIVNADTEVIAADFIERLIGAMERHPRAAFIGPLVFYRERGVVQTTCLKFPDVLHSILVWLPFRLFPKLISRQGDQEAEVEFLNGVCVLCRMAALREIGLMDDSFGAYVEDADWAWRARRREWSSVFSPVPSIVHHEERHGYEHHSFKSFLLKRNTVYWFMKAGRPLSARIYAVAALMLAQLRFMLARGREEKLAHHRFHRDLRSVYRRVLVGEQLGPCYAETVTASAARVEYLEPEGVANAP